MDILKICFSVLALSLVLTTSLPKSSTAREGLETLIIQDSFTVSVNISSPGQSINTIEGTVVYPTGFINAKSVDFANSAVALWINQPNLTSPGEIHFSGAIPGGVDGSKIELFEVEFEPVAEGKGNIVVKNLKGIKNDGLATLVEFPDQELPFTSQPSEAPPSDNVTPTETDTTPPQEFTISLYFDETLEGGKWVALFHTEDQESGIARYEVWETKNGKDEEVWVETKGNYILKDQTKKSRIYVRAIDQAGNIRLSSLEPQKHKTLSTNLTVAIVALLIIVILYIVSKRANLVLTKNSQKQNKDDTHTPQA